MALVKSKNKRDGMNYEVRRQTPTEKRSLTQDKIQAINRSNHSTWLAFMERLSKWRDRVTNSRLTNSKYREKWPLDGK